MSEASAETVFTPAERLAQSRWGDPAVWDRARIERLMWGHIPDQYRARVESLGYFFLHRCFPRNTDLAISADGSYQYCFNDIRHSHAIDNVATMGVREVLAVTWHYLRQRPARVKRALS